MFRFWPGVLVFLLMASAGTAQAAELAGTVRDETGGALPGVSVDLRTTAGSHQTTATDAQGRYRFYVPAGRYRVEFALLNFATARRDVDLPAAGSRADVILHLALSADVTVTGKSTFTNLADAENPAENLVGIAQSASQGAITARQLDARPMTRAGEVLETVPGVVISQHSGEGKANQYYLRGFNLDHGTDFATTVAGMPVNLPTHAHGHGYSDLNFLIPELVSGVQFSKGPYFAEQGDFATAGAANINFTNTLARPLVRIGGGADGYQRALVAVAPRVGSGHLLAAVEAEHNDGPWTVADNFRKVNALVRYSSGDTVNGLAITGMGYRGMWNSTDQIPSRAVSSGLVGRFGAIDPTDGGDTYRYSGSVEWQRTRGQTATKVTAFGTAYDLNLFSNFTFFLDDPVHGDQFQQADHRFIAGARINHRRLEKWGGRSVQNTFGIEIRNDDITNVGLYHTEARRRLEAVRQDSVIQTSSAGYVQNEIAWRSWLRTVAGVRVDGYRFSVTASDPANGGVARAGMVSPKGGLVIGPFGGTELYANAGFGFHSNDARGATITRDPLTGQPADRVTPLVRANGTELGVRTVAIPHLQSTLSVWSLNLASELVFVGDAGTTKAGRPSQRYGIEFANYYSPRRWLTLDGDVAVSRARFSDIAATGDRIPGSVGTVVSAGVTVDAVRNVFASARWRYFGPRPLLEDDSVSSKATSLVNLEAGYRFARRMKIGVDLFNLLDSAASDVDYFYASRLRGEPLSGVEDVHFHPTLPRTARLTFGIGF
jgi:TonB dependent receptor/TonB-dependent Receptor Plug Domain/Carboxypeptidase regulatory-like domain